MSRCVSCNEKFHPTIKRDKNKNFIRFEDMCKKCISASYEEESYDEVFENVRVSDIDGIMKLIHSIYTDNSEIN